MENEALKQYEEKIARKEREAKEGGLGRLTAQTDGSLRTLQTMSADIRQ